MKKLMVLCISLLLITGCDGFKISIGEGDNKKEVDIKVDDIKDNDQEEPKNEEVKVVSAYTKNAISDHEEIKDYFAARDQGFDPYTSLSKGFPFDDTYGWHINLDIPKIDSDKAGAKKLNEKMMLDYQLYIDAINQGSEYIDRAMGGSMGNMGISDITVSYESHIEGDNLIITIKKEDLRYNSEPTTQEKTYIYDIINDQEISQE